MPRRRNRQRSSTNLPPTQTETKCASPPTLDEKKDLKLRRWHHPSHPHRLFRTIVRNAAIFCDNKNCKRRLQNNEVTYVCFRCDFDLCAFCYMLPTDENSVCDLADSDDEVNEDVLFMPDRFPGKAKCVRIEENKFEDEESEVLHLRTLQTDESVGLAPHGQSEEMLGSNSHGSHVATITFESQEYDDTITNSVNEMLSTVAANVRLLPDAHAANPHAANPHSANHRPTTMRQN